MSAILWEDQTCISLPNSQCVEEAPSPMPPISKDAVELHERVAKLEAKAEAYPESMVTWKQLTLYLGSSVIAIIGIIATLSFGSWSYINKKFEGYDSGLSAVQADVKSIRENLDKLTASNNTNNNQVITAGILSTVLKGIAAASDPVYLMSELPAVRSMFVIAKEKKIAIPDKEYKNVAIKLSDRLPKASQELKDQITLTIISLGSAKSSTYLSFHKLSDEDIEKAKAEKDGFWENTTVDLTGKDKWQNTIFKNCKITMNDTSKTVVLTNVKFVEVDFESVPQSPLAVNLMTAVLKTTDAGTTEVIEPYYVTVNSGPLKPTIKKTSMLLKPTSATSAVMTSKARSRVAARP